MRIDPISSRSLRRLSFFCALLIVVLHSYAEGSFVQIMVTRSITRVAVPIFFVISGLMLFKDFACTIEWGMGKLRKRLYTLVAPYFVWAVISLLFNLYKVEWQLGSFHWWSAIFGITTSAPLYAGHLWYVRLVFVFCICALPMGWLIKRTSFAVPIFAILLYVVALRSQYWSSLCWFCVGSVIALGKYPPALEKALKKKYVVWSLGAIALTLLFVRTAVFAGCVEVPWSIVRFERATEFILVATSLPVMWLLCRMLDDVDAVKHVDGVLSSAFFIYLIHPYVYGIVPASVFWILRIVVAISICIGVYLLINRYAPRALAVLTGGRASPSE